jgi:hypothetical protein
VAGGRRISAAQPAIQSVLASLVLITGEQLVDYLESVYDVDTPDYQVANEATRMLMDNLDAVATKKHGKKNHELVVFEGVLRQCKRHTMGKNSSAGFDARVRTLCDLAIALLQHRKDHSVLSINAPDGHGVAGRSVSDNVLQALIRVVRDRSFLHNDVNASHLQGVPTTYITHRSAPPATHTAKPAQSSAAAAAAAHCWMESSDEEEEEEVLLTMPSPATGRRQQPSTSPAAKTAAANVRVETIDLLDSDSDTSTQSIYELLDDSM